MNAKYYWDFELQDIENKTMNKNLLEYFSRKKSEAESIIKDVCRMPLTEVVAKLNVIDEQLRLFFFYCFEDVGSVCDAGMILELIQSEYKQTFLEETIELQNENDKLSFIYLIDNSFPKRPLWELNIIEILAKSLGNIESINLNDWKIIAEYFQYLQGSAKLILKDLDTETFNYQFPKLLLIDTKCRNIVDMLGNIDVLNWKEIEFVLTIENQAKQYLEESFIYKKSGFSRYSFRRQVG
ncbi:hypothetical protein ACQUMI_001860 [Enterococcus faecalis]|uniref:DUF7006 family protein n=1 Tax=Enterococcus faecalis TaxID=1351 RepID=UPI001A00D1C4|nr:hypothetical protein [Enterococcus faecalis]EGO2596439.1 hypothetical protein [Enterococcus faecalis]EGO2806994.1 hypothetical protein [Enterococcus faecalis]EGO6609498.1 hypothetical protein [Enterococcus faecalis]EGO6739831.1 hypothetical protein [Enterococcus faecalis]EGO9793927.1 hypothetical protein [Enterococcus faecalis]